MRAQRGDPRRSRAPFKGLQIEALIIGDAGLPAAMDDPDPFERQRTNGGVMALSPALLLVVVGPRPDRVEDGTLGELVEGLAQELRAVPAPMGPATLAAAFDHRRNPGIGLHVLRVGIAGAVRPEGAQQARSQSRACAGQTFEEERVGMLLEQCYDLLVVLRNGTVKEPELPGQHLDRQAVGCDDWCILRQRSCDGDGGDYALDQIGTAGVVRVVECPDRLWFGFLDGFQRGPLQQPVAGHRVGKVCARPLERLREVQFQPAAFAVRRISRRPASRGATAEFPRVVLRRSDHPSPGWARTPRDTGPRSPD